MRIDKSLNVVVIADNDRAAYLAAVAKEKTRTLALAAELAETFGFDKTHCEAEAARLAMKIVEERQVARSKGRSEQESVREFVGKVLSLQRSNAGEKYRASTDAEIDSVLSR